MLAGTLKALRHCRDSTLKRSLTSLPLATALIAGAAAWLAGPIAQPPDYHAFADQTRLGPLPHAIDVLTNVGLLAVALVGWRRLAPHRGKPALADGWPGYALFLFGLFGTAFGSAYYHWAPDNARLVWDRLPIALACAGLLAGVWSEAAERGRAKAAALAVVAVASVLWWHVTELRGAGDLRPYLLLQGLTLLLIPLWLAHPRFTRADRIGFGVAIALYALAKVAELRDHEFLALTGFVSGHSLKHLLATAAAAAIVVGLDRRVASMKAHADVAEAAEARADLVARNDGDRHHTSSGRHDLAAPHRQA